eukprot:GEMP01021395.1.p1 GENE.GEMP01021395.1~~GEMP01021395.1.p1  ORF type:complete len:462 (+),score=91.45 GEMP01021395.1:51-1436(+)
MATCVVCLLAIGVLVSLCAVVIRLRRWIGCGFEKAASDTRPVIGFLHPYCMGGGGGERVLWSTIAALMRREVRIVVYVEPQATVSAAVAMVEDRFGIALDKDRLRDKQLVFVPLHRYVLRLIEPSCWPTMTILGQSIGSMFMAMQALWLCPPHAFVDTQGFAFSFILARFFAGAKVTTYTHYPIMSYDMTARVRSRSALYNNASAIANSQVLSMLKLLYYKAFIRLYGFMGARAHSVMVNSTWTQARIADSWGVQGTVLYPPADLDAFRTTEHARENIVASIAQFRPEKNHAMQLDAFQAACEKGIPSDSKLILMGSTRNSDDEKIVSTLKERAETLGILDRVEFRINAPFPEIISVLHQAKAGLHTMVDEHFGITLLELLAADLVVISHNSGGPKEDILKGDLGCLCETVDEFSDSIVRALKGYDTEFVQMRARGQASIKRFNNNDQFAEAFINAIAMDF